VPLSSHLIALIALIERGYDAILAQGFAFHHAQPALLGVDRGKRRGRKPRRVGHNLLLRLDTRKQDVLRFLSDPAVPFTNNQAERDGRMMKLRQKISGGFRSEDGAAEFGVIRSLLSTAKKQGWDILHTLTAQPTQFGRGSARRANRSRHLGSYVKMNEFNNAARKPHAKMLAAYRT
jgi:transposase